MTAATTTERVQLAMNVMDLDAAIDFYGKLFDAKPAKIRDGYANFAIESPPLKLVLIESAEGGTINHLGVEVVSTDDVLAANARVTSQGLETREQLGVECCYAVQDKVWLDGPDGVDWEVYTVLGESDAYTNAACCGEGSACC